MPRRNAEEDRKFRELVETRNKADALVHNVENSLKELGDKVEAAERASAESALSDLRTALKGEDKDVIARKTEALTQASAAISQRAYAQAHGGGEAAGAQGGAGSPGAAGGSTGPSGSKDDVVDAEFEEVKDKDRRAS